MGETFPQLLVEQARRWGDRKVALREKEYGIWQAVTWAEYLRHVRLFCQGLVSLGLERGDTVAIVGPAGFEVARGLVAYDASDAVRIAGLKSAAIAGVLGHEARAAMVHRDDLVVSRLERQTDAAATAAGD